MTNSNPKVKEIVVTLTKKLAQVAFETATEANLQSLAVNNILINFGLIKSEVRKSYDRF